MSSFSILYKNKGVIMKYLIICLMLFIYGCAVDTGTSVTESDIENYENQSDCEKYMLLGCDILSSSSYYNNWLISSSSNKTEIKKHYFMTDLVYVGITKSSNYAHLVMKNNTEYNMSVAINYTIKCMVNGKSETNTTKTVYFYFNAYEQQESSNSIDGVWHGGMDSIECTGTILSIIPSSGDRSNFQAWSGNYNISTK